MLWGNASQRKRFDVWNKATIHYIRRHGRFEFTVPYKENNRLEKFMIQVKILGETLCMPVVLLNGVLELVFLSVEALCPFVAIRRTEYPSFNILSFYYENPVYG